MYLEWEPITGGKRACIWSGNQSQEGKEHVPRVGTYHRREEGGYGFIFSVEHDGCVSICTQPTRNVFMDGELGQGASKANAWMDVLNLVRNTCLSQYHLSI